MRVLVLNVGSSSIKGSVVDSERFIQIAASEVSLGADATRRRGFESTVRRLLERLEIGEGDKPIDAVGHRVVHGGIRYRSPVRITENVLRGIEQLAVFAPLHNRVAAEGIRAARSALPKLPQVASFDTAFHATLSEEEFLYPVPWAWHRQHGIRRFGFHGLSVEWSMRQAAELLRRPVEELALVIAHLGSGCSVTAVLNGRSVATSMGLTPMEGLMMGTRSGSIDPGILLYMLRTRRSDWRALEDALDHQSGLVGVSGRRVGMRELQKSAEQGNRRAKLAIEMFVGRAAAGIAAMATALPRIDSLVFTGGIGARSAMVRDGVIKRLASTRVGEVLSVEAREDAVVSRQVAELLSS